MNTESKFSKKVLSESLSEITYYDELYEACNPKKHFKEIKYFSTDGRKTIPNGHPLQKGGFLSECRKNLDSFSLSEAVHDNQYGLSDYRGGIIVFSTNVNAVKLSKNAFKNKIKTIIVNFEQRFFSGKKINNVINDFNKSFKTSPNGKDETICAFSIGNAFKGRYVGDNNEVYNERSMSIEVNGLSSEGLLYLGEMIARAFHQETVLIKDLNKNKIYLANGLTKNNPLNLKSINTKSI